MIVVVNRKRNFGKIFILTIFIIYIYIDLSMLTCMQLLDYAK